MSDLEVTFNTIKALNDAFKYREVNSHAGLGKYCTFTSGESRVIIVLNLKLSRRVLNSKCFINKNYFDLPLQYAQEKGSDISHIKNHWEESILFKEGLEHLELKRKISKISDEVEEYIKLKKNLILRYFRKRKLEIEDAITFSKLFTRITMGIIVSNLTSIPIKNIYKAIDARDNVFCNYFMLSRHISSDIALQTISLDDKNACNQQYMSEKYLLAQSMLTMGIDPMVGTICATLERDNSLGFKDDVFQNCPTSYVSRTCKNAISLEGISFQEGDLCYLALIPSKDDIENGENINNASSLAFGSGIHACIGRRLSLVLLEIVEEVVSDSFPNGFPKKLEIQNDGAFLAFN